MRSVIQLASTLQCACAGWLLILVCSGCSLENSDVALRTPPRKDFAAVSSVFERRCGTLDCHGAPARNLRVYGIFGLRANGLDVTGGAATTDAEVEATYTSLISIDPETLSRVSADAEAPEQWLVLSKGRAREQHKGGERLPPGSAADACILSWLAGHVDEDVCAGDTFSPAPLPGEEW